MDTVCTVAMTLELVRKLTEISVVIGADFFNSF